MRTVLSLGLAGWMAGCQCQPQIPSGDDDKTETTTTGTTGVTGDTAPPPPCDVPEVEPNDGLDETNALPLERGACGRIESLTGGTDLDWWSFTLSEPHWLEVEVDAGNGSIADLALLVQPSDSAWSALREDDPGSTDARLLFEAPPGDYVLTINEQTFRSGDRFGYDLIVSEAKQPFDLYTALEAEPNGDSAQAMTVSDGDVIYGHIENVGLPDQDWFRVEVPAGKHVLSIDVDAYELGSQADLTARFYDAALEVIQPPGAISGGVGALPDPIGEYDSPGNEIVYIQLIDVSNREGPASWYVMKVGLVE